MVLAGAPFLGDLLVRAAWSQVLALPAAWWLLEETVSGERAFKSPALAGVVTAVLWLIHAPTAVMTVALAGLGALLRLGLRRTVLFAVPWIAVAAGLTAWHWMPLLSEMPLTAAREGLTGGIFRITRNWLGAPHPHAPALNLAYSAAAVVLAAATAFALRQQRDGGRVVRAALAAVALALTTALVVPLAGLGLPLEWLQFPWRWLTPAALLLAVPVARAVRGRPAWMLVWLSPAVLLPVPSPVAPPSLGAGAGWPEIGAAVASFGGNPLAVDAVQNRPVWYGGLARELHAFGRSRRVLAEPPAAVEVERWRPLDRVVHVESAGRCAVRLRLLRYPWWRVTVDGRPATVLEEGAAVAVAVPAGAHRVTVRWGGNPLSAVGLAVSGAVVLALLWWRYAALRRRRPGVSGGPGRP